MKIRKNKTPLPPKKYTNSFLGKHIRLIIKKMFDIAGIEFETVDLKSQNWYNKYTWNKQQEQKYREWWINYLYSTPDASYELYNTRYTTKKQLAEMWGWFNLQYGLKRNDCEITDS